MKKIEQPFYPIIYIRGYAMRDKEINDTVATPYMGFNLGSTKIRQEWDRSVTKHIFESPLIRLMKDFNYKDIYQDGREIDHDIPSRSVIIYRYYEQADDDLGTGDRPSIKEAAKGLGELIESVKEKVCGDNQELNDGFKVYLVAHSMGGLIARCFLQNDEVSSPVTKKLVDKVFTYGTPHNGIELRGLNVPSFIGIWDISNFNRKRIAKYMNLSSSKRVDSLDGKFSTDKFFCLVGTNHKDYSAAQYAVGPMSDGLVKIKNATVRNAPRAFTYHSHSGHYGLVNSEEGYQNLTRFLFGDTLIKGTIEVDNLPLPPTVKKEFDNGHDVKVSYYFESTVMPRGSITYKLTERKVETNSAVFRTFDELFRPEKESLTQARSPMMFSLFLDTRNIELKGSKTIVFSVDLAVRTTEYRIDGFLFLKRRIPEENLFRQKITVRATQTSSGWNIRYIMTDSNWGENRGTEALTDPQDGNTDSIPVFYIPLSSKKGFKAKLRLNIEHWNKA